MTEQNEEQIREIAQEVYIRRQRSRKSKDAQSDWETAERILRSRWRKMLFDWHRPFIRFEKRVWEPLLDWANNQALLSLLGIIGNAGIILAVATYIGTEKQRRDAEVLNAWQTITSAHDQSGSGGRIQALEFLNASPGANWRRKFPWFCAPHPLCTWPRENLDGINLSVANPDGNDNDVEDAGESTESNSPGVYLREIELPKASLIDANLQEAVLRGANLQEAILLVTDFGKAQRLTVEQLEGETPPHLCGVNLPENVMGIDPNRDCNKLPQILVERYSWMTLESAEILVEDARQIEWEE